MKNVAVRKMYQQDTESYLSLIHVHCLHIDEILLNTVHTSIYIAQHRED